MKTNQELVEALSCMYSFLGGDGCMQCSTNNSREQRFRCGFSASNKTLIDAIVQACILHEKSAVCKYSDTVVNIEVQF